MKSSHYYPGRYSTLLVPSLERIGAGERDSAAAWPLELETNLREVCHDVKWVLTHCSWDAGTGGLVSIVSKSVD